MPMIETAYFATGCFWGADRRFWQMPGVTETAVGYMGGHAESPTYEQVCTGSMPRSTSSFSRTFC